jgi:retron-type reverse transcriptase
MNSPGDTILISRKKQRLRDLYGRVHRGGYRAQPSKRTFIYKDDGRLRPLGIAALEDKIVRLILAKGA